MKYFLIIIVLISCHSIGKSQFIKFDTVEIDKESGVLEIPILATDEFVNITGYQLGIGLLGDGYELVSIENYGIFSVGSIVYDSVHAALLWLEPNGNGLSQLNGDTLAIINILKTVDSEKCLELFSPIPQIENIINQISSSDTLTLNYDVSSSESCALSPLSVVVDTIIHNSCIDDTDGEVHLSIEGGEDPIEILWTNEIGDTIGINTNTMSFLSNGMYMVNIIDAIGNTFNDSFHISSAPMIIYNANQTDTICSSSSNGFIQIEADPSYLYLWNTGSISSEITGLSSGMYTVVMTDTFSCLNFDTFNISNYLEPSFNIDSATCFTCDDGRWEIDFIFIDDVENISLWDAFGNLQDKDQLLPASYQLSYTYNEVCTVDTVINIPVKLGNINVFKVISVITPETNDDNNVLKFIGLENHADNMLTIFNKWGNIVFKKEQYQQADVALFDGTYHGKPLPEGNYYYILEIHGFANSLKSNLTILR